MFFTRTAQSLNEYAIVIAIITLSVMGISTYVKRGIQSTIKLTAGDLASPAENMYKIQSQTLGLMETGLVSYNGLITTTAEKKTNLLQVPPSGNNPVRIFTTAKDTSTSIGTWSATYKSGDTESFGAKEKVKKLSSGGNKLTGSE